MPIDAYYKGHGSEVMSAMQKHYGGKKGEQVFYATANKKHMLPKMHKGGIVMADGDYNMKAGEMVMPKSMTSQIHKMMYKGMMAGMFGHKG